MSDRHHGAVAIVVNPERTRFFVQQKDEDYEPHPLGYSLFGGAREGSETPAEAIERELREELGAAAQRLLDAGPRHVLTAAGPFPGSTLTLFEVVLDDRSLDSLGAVEVLEGKRGVVLDRDQLAETPFVWNLGDVIDEYLERRGSRPPASE